MWKVVKKSLRCIKARIGFQQRTNTDTDTDVKCVQTKIKGSLEHSSQVSDKEKSGWHYVCSDVDFNLTFQHLTWLYNCCNFVLPVSLYSSIPEVVQSSKSFGSPTIRDRDVSGVGISDRSGLRYRRFGTSVPTVRELNQNRKFGSLIFLDF